MLLAFAGLHAFERCLAVRCLILVVEITRGQFEAGEQLLAVAGEAFGLLGRDQQQVLNVVRFLLAEVLRSPVGAAAVAEQHQALGFFLAGSGYGRVDAVENALLMLLAFWLWGLMMPRLIRAGIEVESMIRKGLPVSMALLLLVILGGSSLGRWTPWLLAAFCVTSTVVSLAQPILTQRLPVHLAGRSLTSFNLLVFAGVFLIQSGVGRLVDALQQRGWMLADAYRGAFGVLLAACVLSYLLFLWYKPGRAEVSSAE